MTTATQNDQAAITTTATDYYDAWWDGDADRMARVLHPQLAKRGLLSDGRIDPDTAETMIAATRDGVGRRRDVPDRRIEVAVDDVHGDIATATVTGAVYIEYLHLVRVDGEWRILHALWVRA